MMIVIEVPYERIDHEQEHEHERIGGASLAEPFLAAARDSRLTPEMDRSKRLFDSRSSRAKYFHFAIRSGEASYSPMNRWVLAASLSLASLLLLSACATDDEDPFPVHPAAATDSEAPVAGAAATPRESSSAGWKW